RQNCFEPVSEKDGNVAFKQTARVISSCIVNAREVFTVVEILERQNCFEPVSEKDGNVAFKQTARVISSCIVNAREVFTVCAGHLRGYTNGEVTVPCWRPLVIVKVKRCSCFIALRPFATSARARPPREPEYDDDLMDIFFQFTNKIQQAVLINAKDNLGRTPLQFAVAHLLPHVVDVLLDHGADLSTFVFSTCFTEDYELPEDENLLNFKLKLASGVLAVTERLVKRGYKLDRDDALTIMKLFANHRLFAKSTHLEKSIYDDEEFAKKAKKLMMNPSLSLYNLIQLPAIKAATQLTFNDYLKFVRSNKLWELPKEPSQLMQDIAWNFIERMIARVVAEDYAHFLRWRQPRGSLHSTGCAAEYVSSRNYEIAWRDRSLHMDGASRAVILADVKILSCRLLGINSICYSSDSCSRIPVVVVAAAATVVVIMRQLVL
ncbi:unnamed protein product, partial [Trichogramma brassicae]